MGRTSITKHFVLEIQNFSPMSGIPPQNGGVGQTLHMKVYPYLRALNSCGPEFPTPHFRRDGEGWRAGFPVSRNLPAMFVRRFCQKRVRNSHTSNMVLLVGPLERIGIWALSAWHLISYSVMRCDGWSMRRNWRPARRLCEDVVFYGPPRPAVLMMLLQNYRLLCRFLSKLSSPQHFSGARAIVLFGKIEKTAG
jgi:hypothetical protein